MKKIERLPLRDFTRYCMSIAQVPSSYLAGLTIEEQLLWLCSFLTNEVIPTVNNNGEAVEELQQLYVQLKDYVDNYFDNLDVQEEVNTKLEEMAQSGELAELISQYLEAQAVIGFNTCEGLSEAENLADGSFARTMGRYTYSDGYGAFYKIRERLNADVPDGYNIIELTNTENLVAEKLIDSNIIEIQNQINNINSESKFISRNTNLTLQRNIIYDSPDAKHIQGLCINGDYAYIYQVNDSSNGNLLKFNHNNYTYVEKIDNVAFSHGNDLAYLSSTNTIYSANLDGLNIGAYNLSTNTLTTLTPFSEVSSLSGYQVYGISKFSNNILLCALTNSPTLGEVSLTNDKFYLYDVSNNNISEMTIQNPYNIDFSNIYARQSIEYKDGKLYFVLSLENSLIEAIIEGTTIKINKIYNLPNYDYDNLPINEFEGIGLCSNGDFVISSVIANNGGTNYEYKFYKINPETNLQPYAKQRVVTEYNNDRTYIKLGTSSNLYEDGTTTSPFKTLNRALCASDKLNFHVVQIINSGTYSCDRLFNKDVSIRNLSGVNNIILNISDIIDSRVNIESTVTFDIAINNTMSIAQSNVKIVNTQINNVITTIYADLKLYGCNVTVDQATIPFYNTYNSTLFVTGVSFSNNNTYKIENYVGGACFFSGTLSDVKNTSGYGFTRKLYT